MGKGNNGNGAKKLTELTLGIADIQVQLDKVKAMVEKSAVDVGKTFTQNVKKQFDSVNSFDINPEKSLGINENEIKKATNSIGELTRSVTKYKDVMNKDVFSQDEYFEKSAGNIVKIHTDFLEKGKKVSVTIDDNIKKQQQALEKEQQAIKKAGEENQRTAELIENAKQKEQKAYKDTAAALDVLIAKQKSAQIVMSGKLADANSDDEKAIKGKIKLNANYIKQLESLGRKLKGHSTLTERQKNTYDFLNKSIKRLNAEYETLNKSVTSNNKVKRQQQALEKAEQTEAKQREKALKVEISTIQQRQKAYKDTTTAVDLLISKQRGLQAGLTDKFLHSDYDNKQELKEKIKLNSDYISQLKQLQTDLKKSGTLTERQKDIYGTLNVAIKKLNADYESLNKSVVLNNNAQKKQKAYLDTANAIDVLISKQKAMQVAMHDKASGAALGGDKQEIQDKIRLNSGYIQQLETLRDKLKGQVTLTKNQQKAYSDLKRSVNALNAEYGILNKRVTSNNKQQANYKATIKTIETLIDKQKKFTKTVQSQKFSVVNKSVISDSQRYTEQLQRMLNVIKSTGTVTGSQTQSISKLQKKIKELGDTFEDGGKKGASFFKQVLDKARWLSAFYTVNGLVEGFKASMRVIKETEDATVSLKRVLSENLSNSELAKGIYDIATEYSRSFNDVQDVATRFAQTGLSWNEVLEATRATMLALNTAELDVEQSTEGLIAVISQWDIETADLEGVIDRINKTADSFPITSEKIVAALQRSSSSAKQANLSLEQTIGIITALGKATGRSGETIGTALNSLIIYTSKAKALETFYEIGDAAVKKTIDSYRSGAASIYDVWKALSKRVDALTKEQQAALYEGIGGDDFAQHLEEHAAVITDQIKSVYGSVGTFRQNYFTALLKEIDTADAAVKNMTGSIGYSEKENEEYQKSLTAMYTQMQTMWREVAYQMADSRFGVLDLMKLLTQASSGVANLIMNLGGIRPVLGTIFSFMVLIKREKIAEAVIAPAVTQFHKLNILWKHGHKSLKDFNHALKVLSASMDVVSAKKGKVASLSSTISTVISVSLIAISTIYTLSEAVENYRRKERERQEEENQSVIESTNNMMAQRDEVEKLYGEYSQLSKIKEKTEYQETRFSEVQKELAVRLKLVGDKAEITGDKFTTMGEKIEEAMGTAFKMTPADWQARISADMDAIANAFDKEWNNRDFWERFNDRVFLKPDKTPFDVPLGGQTPDFGKIDIFGDYSPSAYVYDYLEQMQDLFDVSNYLPDEQKTQKNIDALAKQLKPIMDVFQSEIIEPLKSFKTDAEKQEWLQTEGYQKHIEIIYTLTNAVKEFSSENGELILGDNENYKTLLATLDQFQSMYDSLIKDQILSHEEFQKSVPETAEAYDAFKKKIIDTIGVSEGMEEYVYNLIDTIFPELATKFVEVSDSAEQTGEKVKEAFELGDAIKQATADMQEYKNAIDSAQSALDSAYDAVSEYNEQGYLSIDTLQKLIEGNADYADLLTFTENGLKLNKDAVDELVEAQKQNIIESARQAASVQILALAQELLGDKTSETEDKSNDLDTELGGMQGTVQDLTNEVLSGAIAFEQYRIEMSKIINESSDVSGDVADEFFRGAAEIVANTNEIVNMISKAGGQVESFSKSAAGLAKNQAKEAAQAQKEALQKQKKSLEERYKSEIEQIKSINDEIQDRYDAEKDRIDGLKDEINDLYKEEKRAFENREKIAKRDKDDKVDRLEDEKDAINERYELEKERLDAQKDLLDKNFESQKQALETQKEAIKSRYDAQIQAIKNVEAENDRLDKQEDYMRRKREALKDLEKAKTRSGVEYREKEAEARENLAGIDRDYAKEQEKQRNADKIKALEELRDAELSNIDSVMKNLESQHKLEQEGIEQHIAELEKSKEIKINGIEEEIEAIEEQHEIEMRNLEDEKDAAELEHEQKIQALEEELEQKEREKEAEIKANEERIERIESEKELKLKAIEAEIEAAGEAAKTMAVNYNDYYVVPAKEKHDTAVEETTSNLKNSFDHANEHLLHAAEQNARNMCLKYRNEFINPLKDEIDRLFPERIEVKFDVEEPNVSEPMSYVDRRNPGAAWNSPDGNNYTNYNNDNRTANIYANVRNEQDLEKISHSVFTKP